MSENRTFPNFGHSKAESTTCLRSVQTGKDRLKQNIKSFSFVLKSELRFRPFIPILDITKISVPLLEFEVEDILDTQNNLVLKCPHYRTCLKSRLKIRI